MYDWVINISRRSARDGQYRHYFRVKLEDGHYREEAARERYDALVSAFPKPEYEVSLCRMTRPVGTYLEGGPQ